MFKKMVNIILLSALLISVMGAQEIERGDAERDLLLSQLLHQYLVLHHYSGKKIDDDFSGKGFDEFIKYLDYGKNFLLEQDIEAMKKYRLKIDDEFSKGRTAFMRAAFSLLRERVKSVEGFYKSLLNKPFDFNKDESFTDDPETMKYCRTTDELKQRWRKILKYNALVRYIGLRKQEADKSKKAAKGKKVKKKSDASLETEARESVLKSYKAVFSRILNQNYFDHYSRYMASIMRVFDPHTTYFQPKVKKNFDIEISGTLEGIGALLTEEDGNIKVVRIVAGGPAWRGRKLQAGDYILKVVTKGEDPVDLSGMQVSDAVKFIRGKKGTMVTLTVKKTDGRIEDIPVVRDVVIDEDTFVKHAVLKGKNGKNYGYILLPGFYRDFNRNDGRNCTDDMKNAIRDLKKRGVEGIVLDLRNNGGGSLPDAVKIAGLFIDEGPVVQEKDRYERLNVRKDKEKGSFYDGDLVVLINGISASASEIVAGALQDYGRAVIVGGKHSYGKGTVQVVLDLDRMAQYKPEGIGELGALKMTIKKFYRVTGVSNQFSGIIPDVILPDRFKNLEYGEKYIDYALKADKIAAVDFNKSNKQLFINKLRLSSKKRVGNSRYFKSFCKYLELAKKINDSKIQSLNYDKVFTEQDSLTKAVKKLEGDKVGKTGFKASSPLMKSFTGMKDKKLGKLRKETTEEWLKNLEKDYVLDEGLNILKDLIRLTGGSHASGKK